MLSRMAEFGQKQPLTVVEKVVECLIAGVVEEQDRVTVFGAICKIDIH